MIEGTIGGIIAFSLGAVFGAGVLSLLREHYSGVVERGDYKAIEQGDLSVLFDSVQYDAREDRYEVVKGGGPVAYVDDSGGREWSLFQMNMARELKKESGGD